MDIGYREVVLRSTPARVLTVLVIAACLVAEAGFLVYGDAALALRSTAPLALVSVGAWAMFWRPEVRVSPAEVLLVNPLRTVRIAWPAITDVRTRWGLELETARRSFTAWAAPRSGAVDAGMAVRAAARRKHLNASTPRDAEVRDTASAASTIVSRQWASYRDAGLLGAIEGEGVVVSRHGWTTVALLLLAIATVAGAVAP